MDLGFYFSVSQITLENFQKLFKSALYRTIHYTATNVSPKTVSILKEMLHQEQSHPIQCSQLGLMLDNIEYAHNQQIPVCQDTGHINLLIQLGDKFPIHSNFQELSHSVLKKLTEESIIRPNTVDPISNENPQSNLGIGMPPIYLEIKSNSSDLIVSVLNKGGGSENMSRLFMFTPATGLDSLVPAIVKHMQEAGGKPCPPTILGIGIGGDACKSMYYAKKALFRPIGIHHPRIEVAELESTILSAVNHTNIGVMGLGGHSNCIDAKIEISMRHPATFPVGLVVECYSHRTASFRISNFGKLAFGKLDNQYNFVEADFHEE